MREAVLWSAEGEFVRCGLCPHRCRIAQGAEGICGVRRNSGGTLVPLTYGRVSSIAADPIEKKPVFHYFPGTSVLSLGSVGCSMRCGHCQNWSISRAVPDGSELHDLPAGRVADMAEKYGCGGVAFTYNEPVVWIEYVIDVATACRRAGLYTVMVTNGYITQEGLDLIGELIDVWRVDVKGFEDEQYRRLCKVAHAAPVFEMAERAKNTWKMHVEVVTNVVPGINDRPATLLRIAEWIRDSLGADTPWHLTRFIPYLEFADVPETPLETLRGARQAGLDAGLHFVYLGNVSEPGGEDTICPSCGQVAVSRSGYTVTEGHTRSGACVRCGASLNITE